MKILSEPGAADDPQRFRRLLKEQAELRPITEAYRRYERAASDQADALALLEHENDPEMREMLKSELASSKAEIETVGRELQILLLPKDPNDEKNIFMEIRAGVAAMSRRSSRPTCTACTAAMPLPRAGRPSWLRTMRPGSEVLRRSPL